jgi:hypothetical protein
MARGKDLAPCGSISEHGCFTGPQGLLEGSSRLNLIKASGLRNTEQNASWRLLPRIKIYEFRHDRVQKLSSIEEWQITW